MLYSVTLLAVCLATSPGDPSPEALLQAADRSRGGLEGGITWTVELESTEEGETTRRSFRVRARGDDALAEATAPARNKGEVMLFNGRAIWFVKPGLRKPVSISARQRLSGEAANGDIASTRYARDYEGTLVGEEVVEGEQAYKLELKARSKDVTYDRIRYWVSKARKLALKAEFLTVSGDVFKVATFEYGATLKTDAGELPFITKMTIRDEEVKDEVTVLRFSAPKAEAHPASLFNINNVVR